MGVVVFRQACLGEMMGESRQIVECAMRWILIGLRVFASTSVVFGAYLSLILRSDAEVSIIGGVGFGLWMTAMLLGMAAYRLRGRSDVELTSCQHEMLVVPLPVSEVHARVVSALTSIPARITSSTGERLTARTGIAWGSWGETVNVGLQPANGSTAVLVQSRPRVPTIVPDFRRNRDNTVRVATALNAPVPHGAALH